MGGKVEGSLGFVESPPFAGPPSAGGPAKGGEDIGTLPRASAPDSLYPGLLSGRTYGALHWLATRTR